MTTKDRLTGSSRDHLDRASLSESNNIAEGFERGTTSELLAFLSIARGSAGDVRSMLGFLERRPAPRDFKSVIRRRAADHFFFGVTFLTGFHGLPPVRAGAAAAASGASLVNLLTSTCWMIVNTPLTVE